MKDQLVTIYSNSEFYGSINKYEGKLVKCGVQRYAQFDAAPFVHFIPKGKRKPIGFVKASHEPFLLILKGTGHPEPESMFGKPVSDGGVTLRTATYSGFDKGYENDFNAKMDDYLNPEMILLDVRKSAGTNVVNQ